MYSRPCRWSMVRTVCETAHGKRGGPGPIQGLPLSVGSLSCWLFFFSSRRRHTRSLRDWSSDVCSSDLTIIKQRLSLSEPVSLESQDFTASSMALEQLAARLEFEFFKPAPQLCSKSRPQIGRASCRERV